MTGSVIKFVAKDVMKITFWVFCVLWHVLLISIFLGMKISGSVIIFIVCLILISMLTLIAVFASMQALAAKPIGSTILLKYNSFKLTLLRGWGRLFRVLFISFVGIAGYHWIDPQTIGDTPFPDLTLRQFFSNLFAFFLALGCIVWFFKF